MSKYYNTDFQGFFREIERHNSILISAHINPDGDATGTIVALYHVLKRMGKEVILYSRDPFPFNFTFIDGAENVVHILPESEPDMYVFLDTGSPERVGDELYKRFLETDSVKVIFDHHVTFNDPSECYDFFFIDQNASATAVLIYRFIVENKIEIDKTLAVALYSAIMSDTGGMRYNSTNEEAFEILGKLVNFVSPWEIASNIWENVPLNQIQFLAEVLNEMQIIAGGKAAVIEITQDQFKKYKMGPDNADSFINYARSIRGVELAVRFREIDKDHYKVSLRSRGSLDASVISNGFGGGGHKNAAGFKFKGSFKDGIRLVEEIIDREFGS